MIGRVLFEKKPQPGFTMTGRGWSFAMKGVILMCLQDLVTTVADDGVWRSILKGALDDEHAVFVAGSDVNDDDAMALLKETMKALSLTLPQAADAFGNHWVNVFAKRMYRPYFDKAASAREFLLKMDDVHRATTERVKGAKPPRFTYEWKNDKTLIMSYESHRGLIDLVVGLVKGVGIYYGKPLKVTKLNEKAVEVVFN